MQREEINLHKNQGASNFYQDKQRRQTVDSNQILLEVDINIFQRDYTKYNTVFKQTSRSLYNLICIFLLNIIQTSMKVGRNCIINSNINNFCSPSARTHSHISRINPDKSTFLNSNLLISNILNHLSPAHPQDRVNQPDAYINREIETLRNIQHKIETKNKINRVHHLAKCRSQTTLNQMCSREKDIQKQVEQINVMKLQVNQKARDIMSRKADTAYLGRNIFLQGEKFLKKMKEHNPTQKSNKIEATRMLMKQRAKTIGRHQIQLVSEENSLASSQIQDHNHLNIQSTFGSLQKSHQHHHKKDQNQKDKQKSQKMVTLIKNKSYQTVFAQQKRLATWNGFAQHWAQGFVKNDDLITTKKKKRNKRSPQKYVDMTDNSQLNYQDKLSRHISLKKYCENFSKTASSYRICSP